MKLKLAMYNLICLSGIAAGLLAWGGVRGVLIGGLGAMVIGLIVTKPWKEERVP